MSSVSAEDVDDHFETRPYDKRSRLRWNVPSHNSECPNISLLCIVFSMKVHTSSSSTQKRYRYTSFCHENRVSSHRGHSVSSQSRQDRVRDGTLAMIIHMPTRTLFLRVTVRCSHLRHFDKCKVEREDVVSTRSVTSRFWTCRSKRSNVFSSHSYLESRERIPCPQVSQLE